MTDAVRHVRSFRLSSSGRVLSCRRASRVGPPGAPGGAGRLGASWLVWALVLLGVGEASAESGRAVTLADARQAYRTRDHETAAGMAVRAAEALEGPERGRALLLAGRALGREGRWDEAEEVYGEAAALLPHLSDRIGLARAEAQARLGRHAEAVATYGAARRTTNIDVVAMRAELGMTRARLAAGERTGVLQAIQFMRRYPELPEAVEIDFLTARHHEDRGQTAAAASRYREIWLSHPSSPVAEPARQRLDALASSGVRVRPVTSTERLDRAQKLVSARDLDLAESEILAGLVEAKGQTRQLLLRELAVVAYRRGEIDRARGILEELQAARGPVGPLPEWCELRSGDPSGAVRRLLQGKGPNRSTPPAKLVRVAELYLDAGMYDEAFAVLTLIGPRRGAAFFNQWLPWVQLKRGEYDQAIPGLARMTEQTWSRGRRAYWVGRAHHKAGRPCEARASYEAVVAAEPHGYYALWARQRLGELRDEVRARAAEGGGLPRCPAPAPAATSPAPAPRGRAGAAPPAAPAAPPPTVAWTDPNPAAGFALGPRSRRAPTEAEMREAFSTLIASHGARLPWLERARDLWLSGDAVAAGEELRQARAACSGWASEQAGLPRLWGGRPKVSRPRGARVVLTSAEWATLALLARGAGETGLEMRIDRPAWRDVERWHPLAYEDGVQWAADRHRLAPELLWSIMRIESYFNRYAVSHAHAVGLMQILPRTGRRVSRLSGREGHEIAELMEPEASLDLAGWYLRALLDRFHGQVPLAIASYNGGPHNVAHWILRRADTDRDLPMDEFLEEIPFTETFRYVRRVMASMAVYHAYAGLPPPAMPTTVDRDVSAGVNF